MRQPRAWAAPAQAIIVEQQSDETLIIRLYLDDSLEEPGDRPENLIKVQTHRSCAWKQYVEKLVFHVCQTQMLPLKQPSRPRTGKNSAPVKQSQPLKHTMKKSNFIRNSIQEF